MEAANQFRKTNLAAGVVQEFNSQTVPK